MEKFIYILIAFTYSSVYSQEQYYSKKEIREELAYAITEMHQIHPDLYHYVDSQFVKNTVEFLVSELADSTSHLDYSLVLSRITTLFGDGHTVALPSSKERKEYLEKGGKLFPFKVHIHEDQVFIDKDLGTNLNLRKGVEIMSINGIRSSEILFKMRQHTSGELQHFKNIKLERTFGLYLWYLYQFTEDYKLEIKEAKEQATSEHKTKGVDYKTYKDANQANNPNINYRYYPIDSLKTGVLEFNSMLGLKSFRKFLKSTFEQIEQSGTENLIIDLRQNGGGDSRLANALFEYVAQNEYKITETIQVKASKKAKKYNRTKHTPWYIYPIAYPLSLFIPNARPYFFGKEGSTIFIHPKSQPVKNPKNKFKGKVYFLTSHYTFSSAHLLANTAKCYFIGTLIGQETGGINHSFGEPIPMPLPISGLILYVSHKEYINPCSVDEMRGVVPDIEIDPIIGLSGDERDYVLDETVKLISGGQLSGIQAK